MMDIGIYISQFSNWLHTNAAQDALFRWFLVAILLSGLLFLLKTILRYLGGYFITAIISRKRFSAAVGEYFLYHPPLMLNVTSNLPRVAILVVKRGWFVAAMAKQLDTNDRNKKICFGPLKKIEIGYSTWMSPCIGDCEKSIILWEFQLRSADRARVTVGVMSSISFRQEPYRVPIIVSEIPLPKNVVEDVLLLLDKETTITREIRREAFTLINRAQAADGTDEFEHMTSPSAPILPAPRRFWQFRYDIPDLESLMPDHEIPSATRRYHIRAAISRSSRPSTFV